MSSRLLKPSEPVLFCRELNILLLEKEERTALVGKSLWRRRRWCDRLLRSLQRKEQMSHLYGFSPVCERMWASKWRSYAEANGHSWQR